MTENTNKKPDKAEIARMKKSERNKRYYERKKAEASENKTETDDSFFFAKQTNENQPTQAPQHIVQAPTPQNHSLRDSLIITSIPILLPFLIRVVGGMYLKVTEQKQQTQSPQQSQQQSMGSQVTTLAQL